MRVAAAAAAWLGAFSVAAGLWGLWGWPASALFLGAVLLTGAAVMGAELAKKRVP